MTKTAIELIHGAARNAPSGSLDHPVYLDQAIRLFRFADTARNKKVYVNVPLDNVVALCRNDFWSEGETWREVTFRLHGKGWPHDIFNYFEFPLEERSFPAPASHYELRLSSVGGLCTCSNGNHRLVAGRAWLTEKYGEGAHLKKVKVSSYAVHPDVVDFLKLAVARGAGVRAANIGWDPSKHLGVDGKSINLLPAVADDPRKIFAWVEDEIVPLKYERSVLQRLFPKHVRQPYDEYEWREIPFSIVEGLLADNGSCLN